VSVIMNDQQDRHVVIWTCLLTKSSRQYEQESRYIQREKNINYQ